MNIVKTLTKNITTTIHDKEDDNIALLLEEYYSILLVRMTEKRAYNKLTRSGKISASKLTLYKVINNVSWNQTQSSKQMINQLATHHQVDEDVAKELMKKATPLFFQELKTLAKGTVVPKYLQDMLQDTDNVDNSFIKYLPSWSLSFFPDNLIDNELLKQVHKPLSDSEHSIKSDSNASDNNVSDNDVSDNDVSDNNVSDNNVSNNNVSNNNVSNNNVSNNNVSDNNVSDNNVEEVKPEVEAEQEATTLETEQKAEPEVEKQIEVTKLEDKKKAEQEVKQETKEETKKEAKKEIEVTKPEDKKESQSESEKDKEKPSELKNKDSEKGEESKPKPVYVDASQYSKENISNNDGLDEKVALSDSSTTQEDSKDSPKYLLIVGVILVSVIGWAMLRGCQNSQQPKDEITTEQDAKTQLDENASQDNEDTNEDTKEKDKDKADKDTSVDLEKVKSKDVYEETLINVSTDEQGNFARAKVLASSGVLANKIESAISKAFDKSALDNSSITVADKRNEVLPTVEKLPELLALIKDIPNSSINIVGKTISFSHPDKSQQQKLINQAYIVLSGFDIIADSDENNIEQAVIKAVERNQKLQTDNKVANTPSKLVKLPADDIAVVKLDESDIQPLANTDGTDSNSNDKTDGNVEAKNSEAEAKDLADKNKKSLDIDQEVKASITASKKLIEMIRLENTDKEKTLKSIEEALNTQIINFNVNSNEVPSINKTVLTEATKLLKDMDASLKVIGHTDADGAADYNLRLSQDRSLVIKKYLMSQGLKSEVIKAEGAGETKPVGDNNTEEGKFHNRRIEFKVYE